LLKAAREQNLLGHEEVPKMESTTIGDSHTVNVRAIRRRTHKVDELYNLIVFPDFICELTAHAHSLRVAVGLVEGSSNARMSIDCELLLVR
jgi:hypothetical protein